MFKKTLKKWFTLIEMLIVITIIWVLIYTLIPKTSMWNVISSLETKWKLYGENMVSAANKNRHWLQDFSKQIFGSENWVAATKIANLEDLITTNKNKDTTALYNREYADWVSNVLTVLSHYCSTVQPKYVPDISSYIVAWLWKDKDQLSYSTKSKYDAIDLICTLKNPANGNTKVHVIWIWWNATLVDSTNHDKDKNLLILLSK